MAQATVTPQDQQAEYCTLLSGHTIPAVGLGTWKSGSKAGESVFTAIVEAGYRHIDTAAELGRGSRLPCQQELRGRNSLLLLSYGPKLVDGQFLVGPEGEGEENGLESFKVFSPRQPHQEAVLVSDLIDADRRCWDIAKVRRSFLPHEAEVVLGIPVSSRLPEDSFIWAWTNHGTFTVKSAYVVAQKWLKERNSRPAIGGSSDSSKMRSIWKLLLHINNANVRGCDSIAWQIHWPFHLKDGASKPPKPGDTLDFDMEGVWREMGKLVKENLVKDIGVCNFSLKKLNKLLGIAQTNTMPSVCQMEKHPGWRNDKMLEACKKNGIHGTAYSPLGSSEGGRDLIHDQTVERIAKKLNKSPGQVLVRWAIQRGTSVIPESSNPDRIKEYIKVFGWKIPEQDFQALCSISNQRRVLDGED
ncbi:hypothetical protein CMV_021352 [Castanea mollissima]|uniref:NADP-dependent oxidoreductase domain-containing protein n=1 Tax=Castanea mollissima TaxID=60419 RepID=A0A8J4QP41_9ROSI|nr:hypothetical protein CMV_021352 [Castanea mollissima]